MKTMTFPTDSRFSRRTLLQVGALGGGLTLAKGLELQAAGKADGGLRSAIFVFLEGGPSHQDTFDLKPEAPAEFRGEFRPIDTSVAGVQICEQMPMLARDFGRYAIVRGVTHNLADHGIGKKYMLTGNLPTPVLPYPEYGSVVARQYPSARDLPTYVAIDEAFVGPGYLGTQYSALTAEKPRHGFPYRVRGVTLDDGLTVARYSRQKQLLDDLDTTFRGFEELDDEVRSLDRFSEQAYQIISSPRTRTAFDLSKEKSSESDRFGKHEFGQTLLLACRLIEAGVHFVTVRLRPAEFDFDTHSNNFSKLRTLLPPFDRGLSALLERLDDRGRLGSTSLFVTGEFGRTPKVNGGGGRDHWARAMCSLLAGGDIRGGSVVGASDATASAPSGDGYSPDDLAASFFQNTGIDPKTEFQTNVGRPVTLVRNGSVIEPLFA